MEERKKTTVSQLFSKTGRFFGTAARAARAALPKALLIGAALFLSTCGLEEYLFLYPIPQAYITSSTDNTATVRIPNSNNSQASFSHYAIFYRIYVSDSNIGPTTNIDTMRNSINSILATHYNSISRYIDSDTLINTNMDTLFSGMKYKYLGLFGADINNVLGTAANGETLEFDFPTQSSIGLPTMTINGNSYTLMRSNGNGEFTPAPDRNFVNSENLCASEYINDTRNADVENKSNMNAGPRYTYAAMFIAAVGLDETTWSSFYSTPALIHVFMLPE